MLCKSNLVASIEHRLAEAERLAVLELLREHHEWTLGQVLAHAGKRASTVESITIGELLGRSLADADEHRQAERLEQALRASGADFEAIVVDVLKEAGTRVDAAYLRARVGGPRWKLLRAVQSLVEAKRIRRAGSTSGTRYWTESPGE